MPPLQEALGTDLASLLLSSAIASPEQRQPLLRDLAATANYLLFRRWNQRIIVS
jgi:hypothetical protein